MTPKCFPVTSNIRENQKPLIYFFQKVFMMNGSKFLVNLLNDMNIEQFETLKIRLSFILF